VDLSYDRLLMNVLHIINNTTILKHVLITPITSKYLLISASFSAVVTEINIIYATEYP
jgi:hypothetical protein